MDQKPILFKSRKDGLFAYIILATVLFLTGIFIFQVLSLGMHTALFIHVINLLVIAFLLWVWFGTFYHIDREFIHYHSGPLRGKIPIAAIREVRRDTTLWSGYRPALARKGLIIKYNKFDDIYFSPDSNEAFIQALLEVRPDIPVS